jgi:hypothetical protein
MFEHWSTAHSTAPPREECRRAAFLSMTPCIEDFSDARAALVHRGIDRLAPGGVETWDRRAGMSVQAASPSLMVNVHLVGRCRLRQLGRELVVRPGELMLIDGSRPYELQLPDDQLLRLVVPHTMLGKLLPAITDMVACRLPESASATLLVNQLRTLAQWPHPLSAAEAARVSDLLVGMVRAVIDAATQARQTRGTRRLMPEIHTLVE